MNDYEHEKSLRDEMIEAERQERISGGKEAIFEYYESVGNGVSNREQKKLSDDMREELLESGESPEDVDDIVEEWHEVTKSREDLFSEYDVDTDEDLDEAMESDNSDW